jgi:hypothetical protein
MCIRNFYRNATCMLSLPFPSKHTKLSLQPTLAHSFRHTYIFPFALSFSTPFIALSPSTSTHHPSLPLPPSPPTALPSNSLSAYSKPSVSKLPGCSQTAWAPAAFASTRTWSEFVHVSGVGNEVLRSCTWDYGGRERAGRDGGWVDYELN